MGLVLRPDADESQIAMDLVELTDEFLRGVGRAGCRGVSRGRRSVAVLFVSRSRVRVVDSQLRVTRSSPSFITHCSLLFSLCRSARFADSNPGEGHGAHPFLPVVTVCFDEAQTGINHAPTDLRVTKRPYSTLCVPSIRTL